MNIFKPKKEKIKYYKLKSRRKHRKKKKKESKSIKVLRYTLKIVLSLILLILFLTIIIYKYYSIIKEKENYYRYKRRKRNGYIRHLITFNDKINWLLVHDTNKLKGRCADKILLHEYSKKKLGKDICNKIIKVYDNFDQINFTELPNQFVLKTNHGSGFNIIVKNKTELNESDIEHYKKKINGWLEIDYGKMQAEFHYSFIKRKIFVEEYIGTKLKNYKFLCYDGKPKYVYVSINDEGHKYRNFYDMNWTLLPFVCLTRPHPTYNYEKPKLFEQMKEISKKLSYDFKFVRVDLYDVNNEIRLGELTFTPMNGYFNCKHRKDEIELGKDIDTKKRLYDYFIAFLSEIGYYD